MMIGEGAVEKLSSAVASPRDPPFDREPDGGDELSNYSSCGESDFEKYLSASSAMGTPSFLSSSFQDSDFGSLKSFKLGGENAIFKNLGAKKMSGSVSDRGPEFSRASKDNGALALNSRLEGFNVMGDFDDNLENVGNSESRIISGQFRKMGDDKVRYEGVEIDGNDYSKVSDAGESSSRYDHSDGEDSMFGSGSDDGKVIGSYSGKNVRFLGEESGKNENMLAMNSKVAFGSDDWDDFIQERGEVHSLFETSKNPPTREVVGKEDSKIYSRINNPNRSMDISYDISEDTDLENRSIKLDPLSEPVVNPDLVVPVTSTEDREIKLFEGNSSSALPSLSDTKNSVFSFDQIEDHFEPVKTREFELNDFYDELVNDMEDILLDSGDQFSRPSRDGGSSASTSRNEHPNITNRPLKIDRVEVIGARQKEGDVSLSERLVGVKKYTVYKIQVWSGERHWVVERRYREFSTMYHLLKNQFNDQGWTLPPPWSFVFQESMNIFGNASPKIISDRSDLIQECLNSLIHPNFPSDSLFALSSFLSPSETGPDSPKMGDPFERSSSLGKPISLIVQKRHFKSTKQILDEQHYRCAGCNCNFDDGRTRVMEFVQAFGWGKPRLCEYTGGLFCSSCHNNDTAVLPARVLHHWDFTRYPVSQMAKSYLDSIYNQPMLCLSAVNPFLFSKVPSLQHIANIRNRIGAMLPYVRCPFRRSIDKGLGSRKYLLDNNDFFALRDLIDLSKGMFSALPVMVETVSRKIEEHITEQCLVCYDVGIPCSARLACTDPTSLIFPFQEGEVKKCKSCASVFHKNCFKTIESCPCGARLKQAEVKRSANEEIHSVNNDSNLLGGTKEAGIGLVASLFSKVTPRGSISLRKKDSKDVDNVILMGSLKNTSL